MIVYIVAAICVIVCFIYYKLTRIYTYWERKGIKGPKPKWMVGNLKPVMDKTESLHSLYHKYYEQYPDEKVVGIYQGLSPALIIRDISLIKQILIKDFPLFMDRGFKVTDEEITRNMFFEDGDSWSIIRKTLTPIFTSAKLKQMMPLLNNCIKHYIKYTHSIIDKTTQHEIRKINAKYTLKGIICCAFGLDVDSFSEEGKKFTKIADRLFEPNTKYKFISLLDSIFPGLPILLRLTMVPSEVTDFFNDLVTKIIREREGKPKIRKDFMDLMIELKEKGTVSKVKEDGVTAELEVTDAVIVAQALLFYAAGFETSSGAMSFLYYELTQNPSIQDRCYLEIKQVMEKYNGELTYDALNELQYVSMAFDEALRKHAVTGTLFRQSVTNYKVPDSNLTIEKRIKIFIPVTAIHYDPHYYPEPEKFDPDRFSPENKTKLHDCSYMPFGDGPRNCIGMRFAQVQSILGIAHFLYNFRVEPSDKTPKKITYDPLSLTLASKEGIWLNIKRRQI